MVDVTVIWEVWISVNVLAGGHEQVTLGYGALKPDELGPG